MLIPVHVDGDAHEMFELPLEYPRRHVVDREHGYVANASSESAIDGNGLSSTFNSLIDKTYTSFVQFTVNTP